MAKQLNINLLVDADVKRAKAAFTDLQKTLTNIQASAITNPKNLFNADEIKKASTAAKELQQHLRDATDVNTGRLNLSIFSNSLKASGKDLKTYKAQLESLGPAGEQAFNKVAKSIAMADNPLKKTNSLLSEFKTTLINTARWQISSSLLHGFMGAIQSAYGYAQDLNESLNNIRIVTGQNIDQMSKFAKEANNAAKALSTTTTQYTDASLIYYQQGLSDEEVKRRTDATIKLANVSRQSAEEVSSQMTAIWNNFAKGNDNLEYYEDVITKLGATTASSSSEIANGLSKFASVADTVGLSYEKASAALATVVAETRQSEDIVGTAFKTMFARLEGLNLGETLEDGVDLNKYSKALEAVGVNILDDNGKIKSMNDILDETGAKWQNIGKEQQIALAQTVAGVRQYTQFISLMDNYDKVLKNESVARNSAGTVDEQADIYADSWEAASKRVRASLETIYDSLINDNFFIGVNNTIAVLLEGVNGLIKGLGGVKGIISTAAAFIGQQLAKEAPAALQRITDYIRQINGQANKTGAAAQTEIQQWAAEAAPIAAREFEEDNGSAEYMVEVSMIEQLAEKKRQYNENEASYSQQEKQRAQEEIASLEAAGNALQIKAKNLDELRKRADQTADSLALMSKNGDASSGIFELGNLAKATGQIKSLSSQVSLLSKKASEGKITEQQYKQELDNLYKSAKNVGEIVGGSFKNKLTFLNKLMKENKISTEQYGRFLKGSLSQGIEQADEEINKLISSLSSNFKIPETSLRKFVDLLKDVGVQTEDIPAVLNGLKDSFGQLGSHTSKISEQIISFGSALMQVNAIVSSVTSLADVFSDEDASTIEKVGAVIGVLTTALFAYNAVAKLTKALTESEAVANYNKMAAAKMAAAATRENAGANVEEAVSEEINTKTKEKNTATTIASTIASTAHGIATFIQTLFTKGLTAALAGLQGTLLPVLAVTLLLAAAFALIAGTIAAVTAIVNAISDAYNADAIAAEKAENTAKELAAAYEECKNKYEELKKSIEDYQNAVNALDSLTQGTREWKEQIAEANAKAMELINTYNLLQGKDYTIKNGLIQFNDKTLQDLLEKENTQVNTAQAASIMANNRAENARTQSNLTNLMRKETEGLSFEELYSGILLLGPLTGLAQYEKMQDSQQDINSAVYGLTQGVLGEKFKNNELSDQQLKQIFADALQLEVDDDLLKSIKDLATEINSNTDAMKAANQLAAEAVLKDNKDVQGSKNKDQLIAASGRIYGIEEQKAHDNYLENLSDSSMAAAYLSTLGKNYDHDSVSIDGDNIKYKVGGEETIISKDAVATSLAALEVSETLPEKLKQLDTVLTGLNASGQKAAAGFAASADFLNVTNGDFQKIIDKNQTGLSFENGKLTGNVEEYLATTYGNGDLEVAATTLGMKSGKDLVSAFTTEVEKTKGVWDNTIKTIGEDNTKLLQNFDDLSAEATQNIAKTFESISSGRGGASGAQQYLKDLNSMVNELKGTKRIEALEQLAEVDWTDYNAIDKAKAIMKEYGVTVDETSEEWQELIARMRKVNGAIPDFSKLKNDLSSISKILEKLNFGDIVDEKDYQTLIDYQSSWKDLFMTQADGTYKFIGNAEQMKKATYDVVQATKQQMAERKKAQEGLQNDDSIKDIDWQKSAEQAQSGQLTNNVLDALKNSNVQTALQNLGYDDSRIKEIINHYNMLNSSVAANLNSDIKEKYKTDMSNMLSELNDLNGEIIDLSTTDEMTASLAKNSNQLSEMYKNAEISAEAYDKQLTNLAMSAKSLSELKDLQSNALLIDEEGAEHRLDVEEYSLALIQLASNYENCSNEVLEYQKALASGSVELIDQTQATLENAIAIGEMSKALDLESEKVEEQAQELISVNKLSADNYKIAGKVAILNQSMNKGIKELVDNWDEYKKTLQSSEKGTEDYADAALKTKKALAQLLGVTDEDYIPKDFLELPGVMDLIDKAIQGDEDAVNSLGAAMAKATIQAMVFKDGMKQLGKNDIAEALSSEKFEQYQNNVLNGINTLIEGITNGTLKAGDNISTLMGNTTTSWIESLNQMAYATGMSVEEMNSLLNELGVQADVTVKDKEVETSVPEYTTYEIDGENVKDDKNTDLTGSGGYHIAKKSVTVQTGTKKVKGSISVAQINMGDKAGTAPTITYAGRDNISSSALTPSSSDSSSSSSSKSNPTTKAASHNHEVHRYSNEENVIKGLSEQYDRLNKVKDKAFGKSRIQAIEAEIKHLKALREASGNYLDAIVGKGNADKVAKAIFKGENIGQMIANGSLSGTARADYNSLFGGLSASGKGVEYSAKDSNGNEWLVSDNYSLAGFNSLFGTNLQFNLDSYGNIQNKDAIYNLLQNLRNSENDAYSRIADPSAGSTTEYNRRMAYLEAIKERVDQFEETVDLMSEKTDEYLDYIASIQEKNAELITTKMEHGVNLGQKTIQRLERAIKVLGDNIYKTAEAMSAWFNTTFKEGIEANKQQGQAYAQALAETAEKIRLYDQKDGYFNENAIDPASAAELLSSIEEGYDSLIDDLLNRIEEGKAYYGNVLDYWNEKLDNTNSAIQNNIQLLNHFQTVLNLLGRTADYEAIGIILAGELENSRLDYNQKKTQAEGAKAAYEEAIRGRAALIAQGVSAEALEQYEENVLQKALENFQTKADAMYSALEKYIETANAKFENEINKAFSESEDRLTGQWGSFDDLDAVMQRQRSVSDEYLTKTNQIYEANTLLRKLSQDIDKTDSRIAKEKLKSFANEIESMKVQEKLNKSDLEIAKARYELLQAEIALEDAKNAKTTVRLKRDSSGNYGYIYTADQDAVDDAEQNLADKQNNLYNLVLQQTQEYGEKMIQLRKEYEAEIKGVIEAYQNGEITSREELELKLQDINTKYRELEYATMYSYETAKLWLNKTGAEGQTEAWTSSFDEIITEHRLFNNESENNVTELTNHIEANLDELDSQREYFTEEAKLGNKDLKNTIDEITASTETLSKKITNRNGLADSMNVAVSAAQQLSVAFASQYSALRDLVGQYSAAADEANKLYYKTVNLINAQTAYNIAKDGAKSVSWPVDSGKQGAYDNSSINNNSSGGNNSGNGISVVAGNSSSIGERRFSKLTFSYDPGTGRYMPYINYIDKDGKMKTVKVGTTFPDTSWGPVQNSIPYKEIKKSLGIVGGKTGMYTGSWDGPDIEENGKLAFLHQKELVLNADDTKNMLSAVKLIRQINQSIDLQAAAYNTGASGFSIGQLANSNQTLQQDVTIHADFPNVRDHNEIEEAFNNLINRAVQFANRD